MEIKLGEMLKNLKLDTLDSKRKLVTLFIIICGGILIKVLTKVDLISEKGFILIISVFFFSLMVIFEKPRNKIDLKVKVNAKDAKIGGAKVGVIKNK